MTAYLLSLSALIAAVLLLRAMFRRRISARLTYALWLFVVLRLFLRGLFDDSFRMEDVSSYDIRFGEWMASSRVKIMINIQTGTIEKRGSITGWYIYDLESRGIAELHTEKHP